MSIPYDDPTQWDVTAFKKWRRASCLAYITSRVPHEQSRDELDVFYKGIDEENRVISEQESVNSVVTDNTVSFDSNGELVEESRHDLNVNVSEDNISSNLTDAVAAAVMKENEDSVVLSSVPRVMMNEVNSEEESVNSDVTDNTDSVNSNWEFVEGSRHDLNVISKEPEHVNLNLDDGSATTTTADDINNEEFHLSLIHI